ncbi:MAG: VWA domain-containing protein [Deltaproteobacteria bacterium]|nr:VWA domain-containing protein [Deltaproteobacteria bacterium]
MKRTIALSLVVPTLVLVGWVGCSSTDDTVFAPGPPDSGSDVSKGGAAGQAGKAGQAGQAGTAAGGEGGSAGQGEGGSAGTGAAGEGGSSLGGSGGEPQDALPEVDFTYDAPPEVAAEACATANVEAKLKPLDMYFMIDRSGSMSGPPWTQQANALAAFWNDPASAGITAALRFFPQKDTCGGVDSTCSGNTYVTPQVAWGLLPGNAAALNGAVNATSPTACTPTQEALNGVLKGSKQRQIQQPGHVVVAVLVSDGEPCCTDCPVETASGLGQIAADFFNGTPSVRTFTLYVASVASAVMTSIAQGGGTNQSYDATNTQNFIAALKAIQGSAIPCDFDMPVPDGGSVDPAQVKLEYQGQPITPVSGQAQCGANGGWYFDNQTDPKKIFLCPATCNLLKADPNAKVNISLGCLGT